MELLISIGASVRRTREWQANPAIPRPTDLCGDGCMVKQLEGEFFADIPGVAEIHHRSHHLAQSV